MPIILRAHTAAYVGAKCGSWPGPPINAQDFFKNMWYKKLSCYREKEQYSVLLWNAVTHTEITAFVYERKPNVTTTELEQSFSSNMTFNCCKKLCRCHMLYFSRYRPWDSFQYMKWSFKVTQGHCQWYNSTDHNVQMFLMDQMFHNNYTVSQKKLSRFVFVRTSSNFHQFR